MKSLTLDDAAIKQLTLALPEMTLAELTATGNYLHVSPGFAAVFHRPPAYFIGKNHFQLFSRGGDRAVFHNAILTKQPHRGRLAQFVLRDEAGTSRYFDYHLVPIDGGQTVLWHLTEVTATVAARQRLLELYRHLAILNRRLAVLFDLNRTPKQASDQSVLANVIKAGQVLTGAEALALFRFRKREKTFTLIRDAGSINFYNRQKVVTLPRSLFPPDVSCPRVQISTREHNWQRWPVNESIAYIISVPLAYRSRLNGLFVFGFQDKLPSDTQALTLYEAFAAEAGQLLRDAKIIN